jgi:hypothetical protein
LRNLNLKFDFKSCCCCQDKEVVQVHISSSISDITMDAEETSSFSC